MERCLAVYALNIGLNRIPNTNPWQNRLNPFDVLAIINFINDKPSGEGEEEPQNLRTAIIQTASDDAAWQTAYTQIEEEQLSLRRRRG